VSAYIRSLQKSLEAELEARQAEKERVAAEAARSRLAPLEERLARCLSSIPIEVQREGLSLPALQASLRGRHRGNCHPGELGRALRKLGFRRERRWRSDIGFAAVWRMGGSDHAEVSGNKLRSGILK
jgi:hypothetical protein